MPKDIDFCYLLVYFPIDRNLETIALQWFQRFLGIYVISSYKRNNEAQKSMVVPRLNRGNGNIVETIYLIHKCNII